MPKVTVFRANPKSSIQVIEWTPGKWWVVQKGRGGYTPLNGPYRTKSIALRAKRIVEGKHTAHDLAQHVKGGRKNPRRVTRRRVVRTATRRNPPALPVSYVLSDRALEIAYTHTADGHDYKHKFQRGVRIQLLADGSARLYRPDGRPLWKHFR